MKILKTLQAVLAKMEEHEVIQFRKYAIYKEKKNHLRFFDLLYKYIDKEMETPYLLLFLKKKRIRNLRNKCNNLYKLLLRYWNENPPQNYLHLQVSQLMHGAKVLIEKGLIIEGLELYKEAGELAEKGEQFSQQQEILRLSTYWSTHLAPKNVDSILESSQKKVELLEKKVKSNFSVNLLNLVVHYKLLNDHFHNDQSNQDYQNQIINEVTELIGQEDCSIRTKIMGHGILCYLPVSKPGGDFDLSVHHRKEAIRNIDLIYNTDPGNYNPILIYSMVDLLYKFYIEDNKSEFKLYLEKFRKIIIHCIGKDKIREYHHYEIELINCLLLKDYTSAEKVHIPNTLNYLEKHVNTIPFSFCWSLYSLCFEIYFSTGNLEKAEIFLSKMKQEHVLANLDLFQKYHTRLYEILYNFELENFEYVENNVESTRRLYSSYFKKNKGGKILLKYLLKLCQAPNEKSRIPIYHTLKAELEELFESYYYAKIMGVNILMDWLTAKKNKVKTIQEYASQNNVERFEKKNL